MLFTRLVFLLLLSAALAAPAAAQHALEVISLRHRTADQVLPALRPLLEPGATLTGRGNQLIVRTSPANFAELARALEAIDRPSRRLQISVRYDDAADSTTSQVGAGGRIGDRGTRIDVQAGERQAQALERGEQRIQVLEGGRAYIATGRSTPVLDGSVMQHSMSGFEAVPRLAGGRVLVEIVQQREQAGLSSTVSAPLGEWFEVGSAMEQASRRDTGVLSSHHSNISLSRRVWLRVDEVR